MPSTKLVPVSSLILDLNNFRTVQQDNEINAIHSMISMNPDWFWALTESLLADGYHPTENIIVLKSGKNGQDLVVKEGNRRVGALKLILGYVSSDQVVLPSYLQKKVSDLTDDWRLVNSDVPCAIYGPKEADTVDRIVTLTHGKGEKAGRDKWNAVARARHSRDKNGQSEPALDLLEKYLKNGKNLTVQQAERWGGVYPLSVLDEAIKRLAPRFDTPSSRQLVERYPAAIKFRASLEDLIRDVGVEVLTFETIRDKSRDYALEQYGIPAPPAIASSLTAGTVSGSIPPGPQVSSAPQALASGSVPSSGFSASNGTLQSSTGQQIAPPAPSKLKAVPVEDSRSVMRILKQFSPRGKNRDKVVTLLVEIRRLKLNSHPHAFCFLLRSMFEISAKAYCDDHPRGGPKYINPKGNERFLADILRDICTHLIGSTVDKQIQKKLHGAMAELGKPTGILSVTSLNQLIHNPKFSITEHDICVLFSNIFPLLEEMNR